MFTKKEIRDLLISIIILAIIFSSFNLELLPVTIFIVIIVFASHELSHKFVAQHFGCAAEYKIWPRGLLLGIITGFISIFLPGSIIFAAPGAVIVSPFVRKRFAFRVVHLTRREYGLISLAGPLINIILAIPLLLVSLIYPLNLFSLTAKISFFLAFFNLLPIPPMDGSKILSWNLKIWSVMIAIALIGLFL